MDRELCIDTWLGMGSGGGGWLTTGRAGGGTWVARFGGGTVLNRFGSKGAMGLGATWWLDTGVEVGSETGVLMATLKGSVGRTGWLITAGLSSWLAAAWPVGLAGLASLCLLWRCMT